MLTFANLRITETWTGATSTAWSDATNWSPMIEPTSSDNVRIPAVVARLPVIDMNGLDCKDLLIDAAAGTRLDLNGHLFAVFGNVQTSGTIVATGAGKMVLEASRGSIESLGVNGAFGNTGKLQAVRYLATNGSTNRLQQTIWT